MTTHVAIDLDGTIDAAPEAFGAFMRLLRGDGVNVCVLTGNPTAGQKLAQLGLTEGVDFDELVVLPHTTLPAEKAAWCVANEVLFLIDNKSANAMSVVVAGVPLALIPVTPATVRAVQRSALKRSRRLLDD